MTARPAQWIPAQREDQPWDTWLALCGRGWGKTRVGVETIRLLVDAHTESGDKEPLRVALVAPTVSEARDILVDGESGLLNIYTNDLRPLYEPSKRKITWFDPKDHNRVTAIGTVYSADKPDRLRGHQHHIALADELAAWRNPDAWTQLLFGLRLGDHPLAIVTTTPKPKALLRRLVSAKTTHVTTGSTYENISNLAKVFIERTITPYEGTTMGRQELLGELIDDLPGALWKRKDIEEHRLKLEPLDMVAKMERIVIGVDPTTTNKTGSNKTGIVVLGRAGERGYVLADETMNGSPQQWASAVIKAYYTYQADCIVAEVNQGGDMVEETLKGIDSTVKVVQVRATRGKYKRAEPVAAMYERGLIHHVGAFDQLEDQLCSFVNDGTEPEDPEDSPDNADALVWAAHNQFLLEQQAGAWGTRTFGRARKAA